MTAWYDLTSSFLAAGFGLPDDPTDTLCVDIGIAQALGTITEQQAIDLANLQPVPSRVWRLRALQIMSQP